jgi:hypothetical protein
MRNIGTMRDIGAAVTAGGTGRTRLTTVGSRREGMF